MVAKKILTVLGLLVYVLVLAVIFTVLGMTYGGNFATGFEFMGSRGYEATGSIGFLLGLGLGVISSIITFIVLVKKKKI